MKKCGCLFLCCIFLFLSACSGQTKGEEEWAKASEQFIGFIRPFYEGEKETYTFLDAQNQDKTDAIYQKTVEWAQEEEWDQVHRYVFDHAEVLRRDGPLSQREGQLEQVVTVAAQVPHEKDPGERREVYWEIQGTIWYGADGMVTNYEGRNRNLVVLPQDGTAFQMATNLCEGHLRPDKSAVQFYSAVQLAAQSPEEAVYTAMYERVDCEMELAVPEQ